MKRILTGILLCFLALCLTGATAESLTLDGTVIPCQSIPVYAPIGGTVGDVAVEAGQLVAADDVLYSMKTSKVYAPEDGTVTGVFGQEGDTSEAVSERYGAVLYLEGKSAFSINASTDYAYSSPETKFVHSGEKVYLLCRTTNTRSGEGIITAVSGSSYTIRVDSGTFIHKDSVDVYRDEAYTSTLKIGRGTVERVSPTAITASGAIVRIAVEDADQVKRGDLLLETLEGSFDSLDMTGTQIYAGQAGIVGSLNITQGTGIQKDSLVAAIYPLDHMRVETSVPEDSRNLIQVGDPVTITLEADESRTYQGTVSLISSIADAGSEEVTYRLLVDFVPDEAVYFGMSVIISSAEEDVSAADVNEQTEEKQGEKDAEESSSTHSADKSGRNGKPGGSRANPDSGHAETLPEHPTDEMPEAFLQAIPDEVPEAKDDPESP